MGCGHSKINIYPRKSKSKNGSKKSVATEKNESEDEDGTAEVEADQSESVEDCESKKTSIKLRQFGGPLLAHTDISTSQQDFFRMLDEKIQNGPDYNSESESEKAAETIRLRALLRDWETASIGSRSLPPTPKRRPKAAEAVPIAVVPKATDRAYVSQIPQSVIHQSYGVAQTPYRQTYANLDYHQMAYPSAMQYQALSPMYAAQTAYQSPPPPSRQYRVYKPPGAALPGSVGDRPPYANGDLYQKKVYSCQYQQYQEAREQVLAQNQSYRVPPKSYQSSVTIAVVPKGGQQGDANALQRKQYELT